VLDVEPSPYRTIGSATGRKGRRSPKSISPARAPATLPPGRGGVEEENQKLSAEQKLRVVDAIFPGSGAVITNLARFSDWERWNYDWRFDVEPTLLAIAQRNGPGFLLGSLMYFDKPIGDTDRLFPGSMR
jgi:hypothetical protein